MRHDNIELGTYEEICSRRTASPVRVLDGSTQQTRTHHMQAAQRQELVSTGNEVSVGDCNRRDPLNQSIIDAHTLRGPKQRRLGPRQDASSMIGDDPAVPTSGEDKVQASKAVERISRRDLIMWSQEEILRFNAHVAAEQDEWGQELRSRNAGTGVFQPASYQQLR